jgi:TonB family protein
MLAALTSESAMDADTTRFRNPRGKQRSPLTLFCAASMLLHALALAVDPPGAMSIGQGSSGFPNALHAVLSPLHAVFESTASDSGELFADAAPAPVSAPVSARQDTSQNGEEPAAASGFTAGAFPLPDRWFSADELSVRAEPLTDVQVGYPAELAQRGLVGRVRLLLHIDERGVVRKAQIEESLPEGVFDSAALTAWADVRFSPAMKDGLAVKSRKLLEISFLP